MRLAVLVVFLASCTVQENVSIPLPDCIEIVLVGDAGVKLGKCPPGPADGGADEGNQ